MQFVQCTSETEIQSTSAQCLFIFRPFQGWLLRDEAMKERMNVSLNGIRHQFPKKNLGTTS